MLLDDLVTTIQTVQARIREHGTSLSQNEYRTRISLIDPMLNALGWDVSDPSLVTIEDRYSGSGTPDYGLLGKTTNKPLAFVEAKRLGESLDAHQDQVFKYTWDRKVFYAGLTDGNRWVVRDVTAEFSRPPRDGLLLDVTISDETAHRCALKLLLLWHPAWAAEQPIKANTPVFATLPEIEPSIETPESPIMAPEPPLPLPSPASDWIPLTSFHPHQDNRPSDIRIKLPDGTERQLQTWWNIHGETAEWLIRIGALTESKCPVKESDGFCTVHWEAKHTSGRAFKSQHELSNGLFLEKDAPRARQVKFAALLLRHCAQDPASILLKPSQ